MIRRLAVFWIVAIVGVAARELPRPLARPSYYGQDLEYCGSKHNAGGGYQVHENAGLNNLYNDFAARLNSNIYNVQPSATALTHPIATPQETADIIALYTKGAFKNGVPKIQLRRRRREAFESEHDEHVPVIGKDGVPLETPEVRRAREQHFLAHAMAMARKDYPHANVDEENHLAPIVHFKLEYPDEHIPLIGTNGVPLETPAVKHAKEQHFAAHERARLRMLEEESKQIRKERPVKEERDGDYYGKYTRSKDEPKEYGHYSYNEDDEEDF